MSGFWWRGLYGKMVYQGFYSVYFMYRCSSHNWLVVLMSLKFWQGVPSTQCVQIQRICCPYKRMGPTESQRWAVHLRSPLPTRCLRWTRCQSWLPLPSGLPTIGLQPNHGCSKYTQSSVERSYRRQELQELVSLTLTNTYTNTTLNKFIGTLKQDVKLLNLQLVNSKFMMMLLQQWPFQLEASMHLLCLPSRLVM